MFPISVKHVREFNEIKPDNLKDFVIYIKQQLKDLKIDNIGIDYDKITFSNPFFSGQGRNHIMSMIDKGYFEVDIYSHKITYGYSMKTAFLFSVVTIIALMVFMNFEPGFNVFGILFVFFGISVNWIIHFIRQRMFFSRIIKGWKNRQGFGNAG